jgi:chemotaxis protein histidine kinase CheA
LVLEEEITRILTDLDSIKADHLRSEWKHLIQKVLKLADLLQEIVSGKENSANECSNSDEPTEETERVKLIEKIKRAYDDTDSESDDEEDNEANLPRETESLLIPGTILTNLYDVKI